MSTISRKASAAGSIAAGIWEGHGLDAPLAMAAAAGFVAMLAWPTLAAASIATTTVPASRRWTHADGLADGELFGLNRRGNLSLNFRGVGDATGVGVGLGVTSATFVLRIRLGVREAVGD